ncbi:MAG: hypothetical protein WC942_10385 [Clostridia bacterium]|jgi:hypothetical protein
MDPLVFLDINNKVMFIYSKDGVISVPFSELKDISKEDLDGDIIYIQNASKTKFSEVVKLVNGERTNSVIKENIIPQKSSNFTSLNKKSSVHSKDERKYLHFPKKSTLIIPDMKDLSFRGRYDIKELNNEMLNFIKKSSYLQDFIKSGKIKIIYEQDKTELLKEQKIEQQAKQEQIDRIMNNKSKEGKSAKDAMESIFDDEDHINLDDEKE